MGIGFEAAISDGRLVPFCSRPRPARRADRLHRVRAFSVILGLAVFLVAGPAGAAQGVFLTWNECPDGGASSSNFNSACTPDGAESLFCSFVLDQPADSVIAVEVTLDLQHSLPALPNWWQFAPGACNGGRMAANADFSGHTACVDMWGGLATKDPPLTYTVGLPGGLPSQARVFVAVARPPDQPVRLEAGVTYYAAEIVVQNAGAISCSGCSSAACLVLNSILIGRLPNAPGGNLIVATPGSTDSWATWQGGAGAACTAVPAVRATWGRIKSLYR